MSVQRKGAALACGLLLGGLLGPPRAQGDEAEDRAVEAIRKVDGAVARDEKAPGRPVVYVDLNYRTVTDEGLKELRAFKGLRTLCLGFTQVTDVGLKELRGAKGLRVVYLNNTPVTEAGIADLQKALPRLEIIH